MEEIIVKKELASETFPNAVCWWCGIFPEKELASETFPDAVCWWCGIFPAPHNAWRIVPGRSVGVVPVCLKCFDAAKDGYEYQIGDELIIF